MSIETDKTSIEIDKTSIKTGEIALNLLFFIHCLLLILSKLTQEPSCRNLIVFDLQLLWKVSYLEPSNLIFSFVIEFSDDLIGLALGLGVVMRLSYLVKSSNNRAPSPTTSSFSAMSSDNGELSDNLVGHVLGLAVVVRLSLLKPWINIDRSR